LIILISAVLADPASVSEAKEVRHLAFAAPLDAAGNAEMHGFIPETERIDIGRAVLVRRSDIILDDQFSFGE